MLGIPLVLVVVLARILGGSSDASDASGGQAVQAGETVQETPAPTVGPTAGKGKKNKGKNTQQEPTAPPEPVLAEPSGPCSASDIVATPAIASAPGGSDIAITINLRTTVTEACTWQASPTTMTVSITSGSDFIWSSRQCPASIPPQDVVIRRAVDAPVTVTWSARRSDEGCTKYAAWARLGFYHVEAAALGGEGTDVQFELVAPQPGVVTETAAPQPQGGKGKGGRSHTPGQDGAGNSEG